MSQDMSESGDFTDDDHQDQLKVPLLDDHRTGEVFELEVDVAKQINVNDGICLQPSTPSKGDPYWYPEEQKKWIMLLFMGTTMAYATRTILPLCAVTVAEEFDWDKTDMGLVLGCFFWGYPVFQILGGHLSDKIGGDQVMYRAAFLWSSICMMTPYAAYVYDSKVATVYMMALLRFLMGLTQGVHFPSLTSLVSSRVNPSQKALVLTISFAASSAGSVFTGGMGSILLAEYHWTTIFYTFGAISFSWAICLRIVSRRAQRIKTSNKLNGKSALTDADESEHEVDGVEVKKKFPVCQLCNKVPFWALFVAYGCTGYYTLSLLNWLPTYFTEVFPGHKVMATWFGGYIADYNLISSDALGLFISYVCNGYYNLTLLNWMPTFFTEVFPGHKGWVFNVLPWLVQIPTSIASGVLSGKLTDNGYETGLARKIVYTICAFGMVSSLVTVSLTSNYNMALFLMVNAIGWSAFSNGALPVNIQDIAPNQAGAVYGILNTVGALQGFIGSYITGYILHLTESWATVFCSTSTVLTFGWIVFVLFGSGKPII